MKDDEYDVKSAMRRSRILRIMHNCRSFLRYAITAAEAYRRPKHFAGLEAGLEDGPHPVREAMFAMLLAQAGPAFATGGVWTQLAISKLPTATCSNLCPRCNLAPETIMHRL